MPILSQELSLLLGSAGPQQGWQETLYPAVPAAGASFTRRTPGETYERYVAVNCRLTTSAVVANRQILWQVLDTDGVVIWSQVISGSVVASSVYQPYLAVGMGAPPSGISGVGSGGMPDLLLPPGYTARFLVNAIDVADQVDHVQLVVQRFPSNAVRATAD